MDNRPLATSSYKEALKLDVYCFEAFDLLTSHHMLTAQEGEADLWQCCVPIFNFLQICAVSYNFNNLSNVNICEMFCVFSIEKDFLDLLPLSQQCTEEEEELLHFLFENKLKKVRVPAFSFESFILLLLLNYLIN